MPTDSPNVLWICADQLRADVLGCYGDEVVETPAIDGLAAGGVRFESAYCQHPLCTPSRASFLTGRYPRTTRCRQNGQNLPDSAVLLPRLFAAAGYECGLTGKFHVSSMDPAPHKSTLAYEPGRRVADGYGYYRWSGAPGLDRPGNEYRRWLDEQEVAYETEQTDACEWVHRGMDPEYHQTTWCVERAREFVTADHDGPWLCSVNVFDPHQPFDPPAAYLDRVLDRVDSLEDIPLPNYEDGELAEKPVFQRLQYEGENGFPAAKMDESDHRWIRAAYYAMIELLDDGVARLLDALEDTGQREDTLVVFQSDHGELLGDHGIYRKGPQFYEPAVNVPLVVAGPGVEGGVESETLVELVDLAPTLCDATGVEAHPGMQGTSRWPVLAGETDPDDGREDIYCEFYNCEPYDRPDEDPLSVARDDGVDRGPGDADYRSANATMLRTDAHKLVVYHGLSTGELYDLQDDPDETHNRWGDPDYADVQARLLRRLTDRMAWTVDPLPERAGSW